MPVNGCKFWHTTIAEVEVSDTTNVAHCNLAGKIIYMDKENCLITFCKSMPLPMTPENKSPSDFTRS